MHSRPTTALAASARVGGQLQRRTASHHLGAAHYDIWEYWVRGSLLRTRGGQRSNFRPKRSNFSPVPRHTKAKLEGDARDPTLGGQRSNFRPKRSNFSPVPRHTKAKLEGPTPSKKARRAKRAAPFLSTFDLPILPLCAVAQAKSWTFLVESWTFDRGE